MNILLTNDDGYNSLGILTLKKCLSKYGRVVIVAPSKAMSAKSCSITITEPLYINRIEDDVFSCSGTPCDCVNFALSSLSIDFDLVVSGCNHGPNISYDTMYSGTIGACLEALKFRKPTFAVSCFEHFDIVEKYFDEVFDFIKKNNLISNKYLLNVNYPRDREIKGIELGTLYYRHDEHIVEKSLDGYQPRRKLQDEFSDKDSDCYQVEHGIISIVPLSRTYFEDALYLELKKKIQIKK